MASISRQKNGRRTIQFVGSDRRRRSIRLGKMSQRDADAVKVKIERLVAATITGHAPDDETSRWVAALDAKMSEKLVRAGLIPKPKQPATIALGPFLHDYISSRIDVKPATKEVWQLVVRNLLAYFGAERDLAAITEGDADLFKMFLIQEELASTTVAKRLQFTRMFFDAARKQRLISANPFAEVKATSVVRLDGRRFITPEETERLLAVCDPTWRMIVALARYGGLRTPSETLSLRWQDVDWNSDRIVVQSPKTEHHPGKGSRVIPLFPELKPILAEAFELAPEGAKYVVGGNYRERSLTIKGWKNCNLRTQFKRLIQRAGLTPWPRLFHAMRASRETELAKDHPIHVVVGWMGNTVSIAMRYYLQITDADFDRATQSAAESGAVALQKPVQQPHAPLRTELQETKQVPKNQGLMLPAATCCDAVQNDLAEGTGLEPATGYPAPHFQCGR